MDAPSLSKKKHDCLHIDTDEKHDLIQPKMHVCRKVAAERSRVLLQYLYCNFHQCIQHRNQVHK